MKRKSLVLMALADPFPAVICDSNGKSNEKSDVHVKNVYVLHFLVGSREFQRISPSSV
jgi:hypothetical protein